MPIMSESIELFGRPNDYSRTESTGDAYKIIEVLILGKRDLNYERQIRNYTKLLY